MFQISFIHIQKKFLEDLQHQGRKLDRYWVLDLLRWWSFKTKTSDGHILKPEGGVEKKKEIGRNKKIVYYKNEL